LYGGKINARIIFLGLIIENSARLVDNLILCIGSEYVVLRDEEQDAAFFLVQ
jgi:hypothetical protein